MFKKIKRKTVLKIITIIISLAILSIVCIEFYPLMKEIATPEGKIAFKNKIKSMGIWGVIILFLIESAQMIFVILPGEPVEVLYGMCYGGIWGAVLLTLAVFINTIIVYLIVKKYGKKTIDFLFSKEKVAKIENSKLFQKPKNLEYIMMLLFFLPGTPKDLLLYIGALLPIDAKKFILISTFVRFPSVITSTIAGEKLVEGNIGITIAIYVVTALIILPIMFLPKKFQKDKESNEIIKDIMKM